MAGKHTEQAQQLAALDQEISALYQESLTKSGSAKSVVEMQLLNKNDELRSVITTLIDNRTDETTPLLLQHVKQQVTFISQASAFLSEKITAEEKKNSTKPTRKRSYLYKKNLDESRRFYTRMLGEQWVNYKWLELLGAPSPQNADALIEDISHRLEFMSASLSFNNQQEALLIKQLKTASEGEKPSVQLQHLLTQRNVASDIDNLKFLVELANTMEIDTTQYTQKMFEVTGNLTDELLKPKVLISLFSSWVKKTLLSGWSTIPLKSCSNWSFLLSSFLCSGS